MHESLTKTAKQPEQSLPKQMTCSPKTQLTKMVSEPAALGSVFNKLMSQILSTKLHRHTSENEGQQSLSKKGGLDLLMAISEAKNRSKSVKSTEPSLARLMSHVESRGRSDSAEQQGASHLK